MDTSPCHNSTMSIRKGVLTCDVCHHEVEAKGAPTPAAESASTTRRKAVSKKAK